MGFSFAASGLSSQESYTCSVMLWTTRLNLQSNSITSRLQSNPGPAPIADRSTWHSCDSSTCSASHSLQLQMIKQGAFQPKFGGQSSMVQEGPGGCKNPGSGPESPAMPALLQTTISSPSIRNFLEFKRALLLAMTF